MGAKGRNTELFGTDHITGADTSADHCRPCAKCSGVRPLGAAQPEFHNASASCRITDSCCLRGNKGLVVDEIQKGSLDELSFHNGCHYLDKGFHREDHRSLWDRIHISCKVKTGKVIQKVFAERTKAPQIINILIIKMQFFDIINDLCKAGTYRIAAVIRILAVKQVKDHTFAGIIPEIPLHHRKFVKICEKSKISVIHVVTSHLFGCCPHPIRNHICYILTETLYAFKRKDTEYRDSYFSKPGQGSR